MSAREMFILIMLFSALTTASLTWLYLETTNPKKPPLGATQVFLII
jgi:hypothetical protein